MNDTVEVIQEESALPVETPVTGLPSSSYAGTPQQQDDLDSLLREYDETVGAAEPQQIPAQETAAVDSASNDELDALLRQLDGPSPDQQRADALQGQVNELHAQLRKEQDWAEFTSFANDLQKQAAALSPHVDENFVRLRLESAAHNPEIALAWDVRHINPADASRDLAYVEHSLRQLQSDPNADRGQIQQLQTLAYQLNIAANSPSILRRLKNTILTEAKNLKPPIDADATALRDDIAFLMKQGQGPAHIPEAPVQWGKLSAKEGRERVLKEWGFDPGWSH